MKNGNYRKTICNLTYYRSTVCLTGHLSYKLSLLGFCVSTLFCFLFSFLKFLLTISFCIPYFLYSLFTMEYFVCRNIWWKFMEQYLLLLCILYYLKNLYLNNQAQKDVMCQLLPSDEFLFDFCNEYSSFLFSATQIYDSPNITLEQNGWGRKGQVGNIWLCVSSPKVGW